MKMDSTLFKKYGVSGPRYTSYPTALQFHSGFTIHDYFQHVEKSNQYPLPKPLSLYLHIPFCHSLCYYCGCHKLISHDPNRALEYVEYLKKEIILQSELFDNDREVKQIHFGGGTPTYLNTEQLTDLLDSLRDCFTVAGDVEIGVEIDPRTTSDKDIISLHAMGFNRMSFGIQDFDPAVQAAIHRLQDQQATLHLLNVAREIGVDSLSVDIIYGLPQQTVDSFTDTLKIITAMRPDRIALYHYAHIPERIKSQKLINSDDLPSSDQKLDILSLSINTLISAGYLHIGMDHFALPSDSLSVSLQEGALHRNFQGYSTHGDCDIIGLGVSAISRIDDSYSQNEKFLKSYYEKIREQRPAIIKGFSLSADDSIRADVIQKIMCQRHINFDEFNCQHHIYFEQYFFSELDALAEMVEDGLIIIDKKYLSVTDKGCLLLRNIAMVFDTYLSGQREQKQQLYFSKAI